MSRDALLAVAALAMLAGFLGVLVGFVPRLDLIAVAGLAFAFAAIDVLLTLRRGGR